MSAINPQDPVVAMLKQIVDQYEQKLDAMGENFQEALRLLAEGNAATFQVILQRLSALESKIGKQSVERNGREL